MAGDWIKIELTTPDKPEVFAIAEDLGIDPDAVFGKLFRVWAWFDQQTEDGNARSVTKALVDRISGVSGFAESVAKVGWLEITSDGITLPNFDKHNGKTAKKRAVNARRSAKHKAKATPGTDDDDVPVTLGYKNSNARSVSNSSPTASPREEKRERRDINNGITTRETLDLNSSGEHAPPSNTQAQVVIDEWNLLGAPFPQCRQLTDKRRAALRQRLSDPEWKRSWRDALDRLKDAKFARGENNSGWTADIDFFLKPDSVVKILEGKYDHGESKQAQRTFEPRITDRRHNSGQVYQPGLNREEFSV